MKKQFTKNKKIIFDQLANMITQVNYKLISTEYKNTTTPLELICDINHKFKYTRWQIIKSSRDGSQKFCPTCRSQYSQYSYDFYVWRNGEQHGKKLFEAHKDKLKKANTLERYIEKYGKENGHKRYNKWKEQCRKNGCSLEIFKVRYGENEGQQKWKEYCNRVYRKRSKENYIKELGIVDGTKKWESYKQNLKKAKTLERYVQRLGEELGKIKYEEYLNKLKNNCWKRGASKLSIEHILPPIIQAGYKINDIFIGISPSKEFQYRVNNKIYYYDCVIPNIKLVIEFNSLAWHCDPTIMSPEKFIAWKPPKGEISPADKYIYDLHKIRAIEKEDYEVLVIWQESGVEMNHKLISDFIEKRYLDSVSQI